MRPSLSSFNSPSTPKSKIGGSIISQSSTNLRNSITKSRSKKRRIQQLTLIRRGLFRAIDNEGNDRTPKLLSDPDYQVLEGWQPTVLDFVDSEMTSSGSQISLQRSYPQSPGLNYGSRQGHTMSLQMSFTNIANVDSYKDPTKTLEGDLGDDRKSEDRLSEIAPSAFRLRDLPSREFYPPHSKVPLIAKETESFTLFSMNSSVDSATGDNAEAIMMDNEYYEYLTVGKGKYTRKLNNSEQQTSGHISTPEACLCPRMLTKNNSSWVTLWKLYDEYFGSGEEKKEIQGSVEEQWAQLAEDPKFLTQGLIMERILGSLVYREPQLIYRKSLTLETTDLDAQFTYSAKILWEFKPIGGVQIPVSAIAINTLYPDIIAVGHGKFFYSETDKGLINIWCVKNPLHPERVYKFHSSVKYLDFATWTPNLLGAGFLNGDVLVIDVSSFELKIMLKKDSVLCDSYERIIYVKWWICTNIFNKKDERLMITTGDGRIIQFRRKLDALIPFQMMRITRCEGKIKGIESLRKCEAEEISLLRFPPARGVVRYPNDHQFYLVSSDDGSVHKCSTNFFTQHVESFLAHDGPVYNIEFSPFCNKLFLTCGSDGAVRLWAWDIFEPLITLSVGPESMEQAAWSPRNSTIIASISSSKLYLWDLRRKTYFPASTMEHPKKLRYISLKFCQYGNNIMLGDVEGSVYMMSLYGMPFEEIYKEDVLAACIEKELVVKPKLLELLKKSGPPFSTS